LPDLRLRLELCFWAVLSSRCHFFSRPLYSDLSEEIREASCWSFALNSVDCSRMEASRESVSGTVASTGVVGVIGVVGAGAEVSAAGALAFLGALGALAGAAEAVVTTGTDSTGASEDVLDLTVLAILYYT